MEQQIEDLISVCFVRAKELPIFTQTSKLWYKDHFTRYIIKVSNNYGCALCRANWKMADYRGWSAQNVNLEYFYLAQPMFELLQFLPMSYQTGELLVIWYFELPPHSISLSIWCFFIPGLELAPGPSCRSHMSRGNACLLHKTQLSPQATPS